MGEYYINLGRYREGDTLVVSKCELCGGAGTVKNEWFERCAQEHGESQRGQCGSCEWYQDCYQGEIVECEACNGCGKVLVGNDDESDEHEPELLQTTTFRILRSKNTGSIGVEIVRTAGDEEHKGFAVVWLQRGGYTEAFYELPVYIQEDVVNFVRELTDYANKPRFVPDRVEIRPSGMIHHYRYGILRRWW